MTAQRDRCHRCSSTNCTLGKLTYTTPTLRYMVQFEPDEASGFAISRQVAVAGLACLDCGHIEMILDIDRAKKLVDRS